MDREEYESKISNNNTRWLRDGDKTLYGLVKASSAYGDDKNHKPVSLFRILRKLNIDCVWRGKLSEDFSGNRRPLIPVIYCHGLSSNRTMHSGSCRDLASHGYIVFMLDHKDETSSYI